MADCYDGLQRGVLDGVLDSLENWKNFKLADLLNHCTLSQRGAGLVFTFYVAMTKESWDALPDDIKQIFTQVSAEWQEKTGVAANQQEIDGRDFLKGLGGKNIYSLSDEETKKWQRAVEPVIEQHMKELEAKGFKRSETGEYLTFIRERIDYWAKQEKERKIPVAY